MRVAGDGQVDEVGPGIRRSIVAYRPRSGQPPQRVLELDVQQVRRVEVAVAQDTVSKARDRRPAQEEAQDGRGVDDDQGRSRPERTASTMSSV